MDGFLYFLILVLVILDLNPISMIHFLIKGTTSFPFFFNQPSPANQFIDGKLAPPELFRHFFVVGVANIDFFRCTDIDECVKGYSCPRMTPICTNIPGSYVCSAGTSHLSYPFPFNHHPKTDWFLLIPDLTVILLVSFCSLFVHWFHRPFCHRRWLSLTVSGSHFFV